jgi:hypothetical protein
MPCHGATTQHNEQISRGDCVRSIFLFPVDRLRRVHAAMIEWSSLASRHTR